MNVTQYAALLFVFVLAGGVKGVTGMGLPTVAVSLLGLWMSPAQAATLLVAPSLLTNIAQCRGPHFRALALTLWPAWLSLALVTSFVPGIGPGALAFEPRRLLGCVLLLYGIWGLWRPGLPDLSRHSVGVGVVAGGVTGCVTALTAVFVIPLVPFLQALKLDKEAMVQALGLSFTVATLALAVRLKASDNLTIWSAPSVLALAAAVVGLAMGTALRARLSGFVFQRALFVVFIGLGIANVVRGV